MKEGHKGKNYYKKSFGILELSFKLSLRNPKDKRVYLSSQTNYLAEGLSRG
jgi:hypothetical protein